LAQKAWLQRVEVDMFQDLEGKRILITGASSGIGACTAELFAQYRAVVGVHYNESREQADKVVKKIQDRGHKAILLQANLIDENERSSLVSRFIEGSGGIDVLINNAGGVYGCSHFLEIDIGSWRNTLELDLTASFFLARDAFRYMKEHGGGKIINISSIAAKYGGSETTIHYGAAKAGLDAVTRTMARAGAKYRILVNSIQLGVIDTPFHRKIGRATLEDRVRKIPLLRAGTPLDVSRMCLFLASECGDYITGQVYGVTGGD
jgi:3-oxoacyl-[acyl-carrier protein] reductase